MFRAYHILKSLAEHSKMNFKDSSKIYNVLHVTHYKTFPFTVGLSKKPLLEKSVRLQCMALHIIVILPGLCGMWCKVWI